VIFQPGICLVISSCFTKLHTRVTELLVRCRWLLLEPTKQLTKCRSPKTSTLLMKHLHSLSTYPQASFTFSSLFDKHWCTHCSCVFYTVHAVKLFEDWMDSLRRADIHCELASSVGIVSGYGLDDRAIGVRSPAEAKLFFSLASVSRPALRPTQPPVQWVPGVLSPGLKRGRSVTLTTHLHLVPRSKMRSCAFVTCSGTALAFRHTLCLCCKQYIRFASR
jgi:hypothetical protein